MIYQDIDYINEFIWLIKQLSYFVKNTKQLSESSINEMQSFAIDLLELLEQYKNDKYDY